MTVPDADIDFPDGGATPDLDVRWIHGSEAGQSPALLHTPALAVPNDHVQQVKAPLRDGR